MLSARPSRGPVELLAERHGGVDERQVGECLGETAELLARRSDLLGEQTDMVGVGEHIVERVPSLVDAAGLGEGLDIEEGVQVGGSLGAPQPVGGDCRVVAVDDWPMPIATVISYPRVLSDNQTQVFPRPLPGRPTARPQQLQGRRRRPGRPHARDYPGAAFTFEVLGRANAGKDLDVLEESWIRAGGGKSSVPGSVLTNKRVQMVDKKYKAAGGTVC